MGFEIIHNEENDTWYWKLTAVNGETLCHSENYESKQGAYRGIRAARTAVLSTEPIEDED